jgi:GH15 family glucan-1,4-alpha-glucosidase
MTPDSANFALFALGALAADDPKVEQDMLATRQALWVKTGIGGIARYQRDYFHQVERERISEVPGNPWVICTLWHAQWLIARATTVDDLRNALPYMDWAIERADLAGVMAEQYHPYTGEPLGVSPLTWSHATFVIVVMEYLKKHRQIMATRKAGGVGEGALGGAI